MDFFFAHFLLIFFSFTPYYSSSAATSMPYPGTVSPGEGESSTVNLVLPSRSTSLGSDSRLDGRNILDRQRMSSKNMDAGSQVDLQIEEMQSKHTKLVPPKGWLHFAAGGFGGMCGAIVTSPLDLVKTRLQSSLFTKSQKVDPNIVAAKGFMAQSKKLAYHFVETGHILRTIAIKESPRALFKGLGPTLVGVVPARSINFYTYGNGKLIIADQFNGGKESSLVHLSAAAIAGVTTATATNPIWVVKTRLQLESHAIDKAVEATRQAAVRKASKDIRGQSAAFSTSSKYATTSSHAPPVGSIESKPKRSAFSRFFKPAPNPPRPSTNSIQMTMKIVQTEGIAGLYKGMSASYLGVAEGTIQWTLYEKLKSMTAAQPDLYSDKSPSRFRQWMGTVGAAGTAKLAASLITYPHEVSNYELAL